MIFITDELGNTEKNILELVENVGVKDCKTIETIDLFCGPGTKNRFNFYTTGGEVGR
mgnify:CR=1 FL=1